jgi:hypothetical protein
LKIAQVISAAYFQGKSRVVNSTKMGWAKFREIFLKAQLGTMPGAVSRGLSTLKGHEINQKATKYTKWL